MTRCMAHVVFAAMTCAGLCYAADGGARPGGEVQSAPESPGTAAAPVHVSGLVKAQDDKVGVSALLVVARSANKIPLTTATDEAGAFELMLPSGTYELEIVAPHREERVVASQPLVVAETKEATVTVQLSYTRLSGTVVDQSGRAVPACTVRIADLDRHIIYTANTTSSGTYEVQTVVPGRYQVVCMTPDMKQAGIARDIEVKTTDVRVDLVTKPTGVKEATTKGSGTKSP